MIESMFSQTSIYDPVAQQKTVQTELGKTWSRKREAEVLISAIHQLVVIL
jgi:hypothetical protein